METGQPPLLVPPRGGHGIGDYTLRDFAAKWLVQQDDLAEIDRYRAANETLEPERDGRRRIVLFGDSITEFWPDSALPDGGEYRFVNRGIAGQNTSQMLLRFEDDVVALEPAIVVLLGGTNDLRSYAGPPAAIGESALRRIARNTTAMADIAAARGIHFMVGMLPPVGDGPEVHRDPAAIIAVNRWLVQFADRRSLTIVDYHAALVDAVGSLPADRSADGVHPTANGYARMRDALHKALHALGNEPATTNSDNGARVRRQAGGRNDADCR